ncbi:MAG: response regulator transcription factor [Pseudomonadota bacterium]
MTEAIKVMLVDDHPMVQDGLSACLSFYDDIDVVGVVNDGNTVLDAAIEKQPDIILMDISMPSLNGLDATEIVKETLPDTHVLIFSMHDSKEFVSTAVRVGASGYILKDTHSEEVYLAIKTVASGKSYFSSSIAKSLMQSPDDQEDNRLTTREQVILGYIAEGQSSKEIANVLCISVRTVEAHRRNIKSKLAIDKLAELVRYALNHGLIGK